MNDQETFRLNKAIAMGGLVSRRKADELIKAGKVKLNGSVVFDLSKKVSFSDKIEVNGKLSTFKNFEYMLFYKPSGFLTTRNDERNRKTIYDLLPAGCLHLKSAGRLDRDTEGLLILSNDGDYINRVIRPQNNVKKTYLVQIDKVLEDNDVDYIQKKLMTGIALDCKPIKADLVKQVLNNNEERKFRKHTVFKVVIHEGINRQIRRMFQVIGFSVSKLKRIQIGHFNLSDLRTGQYKIISKQEAYAIFN